MPKPDGQKLKEIALNNPPEQTLTEEQDRLTVVFNATHEHFGEQPTGVQVSYSQLLQTVEQPFVRRFTVGPTPVELPVGWVESVGTVILQNKTGTHHRTIPTEEQKAEDSRKVLEVVQDGNVIAHVPPGQCMMFQPADPTKLKIQCSGGDALGFVHVFPK